MLSLLNMGIEPSAPVADTITFYTAMEHIQSIRTDCSIAVEKIKDLLGSPKTTLYGLILLKSALKQNSDVYVKGNWSVLLHEFLTDSVAPNLKAYSCEVFCILLPYMAKDAAIHSAELRKFSKEAFPYLIGQINENVEWSKVALKCIHTCLKVFPQLLIQYRKRLIDMVVDKASYSVSSHIVEVVADCFAEFPNLIPALNPDTYLEEWNKQFKKVINTLHELLNSFLKHDPFASIVDVKDAEKYITCGDDDSDNIFQGYMKTSRQFVNFCRCMSKMLSVRSRFAVEVPVKDTVAFISRLFQIEDFRSVKPTAVELQIFYSLLSQMQLASLVVLESLLLNLDILPYSSFISELLKFALESSELKNISDETVSEVRLAVWKFLKIFLKKYGSSVSTDVIKECNILEHLLKDISIEDKQEASTNQTSTKSKKTATNSEKKRILKENKQQMCKEALEVFEQLVYTGSFFFRKDNGVALKDIFSKVLQIACKLRISSDSFPFPYNDGLCRKNLYSVLLSLAVITNIDHCGFVNTTIGIFKNAFQDPDVEVTGFCNIGMAMLNAKIHPKRPPLKYKPPNERQRSKVSNAMVKYPEWTSEDFVPNPSLENTKEVHDSSRLARTFHDNEGAILQEELMEEGVGAIEEVMGAEPQYTERYSTENYVAKYHEQGTENHHNGDDILELHQPNQCQDEESDEEDEEDDDDRSYGEEEINQGDIPPQNMYIPSTSKLQVVNPVRMNPETVPQNVSDREYEQLRPCLKTETSSVDSNKNMHLNGVRSIVPDADVPSSSTQPSLANENGAYVYDEEDLEEEEEEGEEDEEEETASFPAEKRVPTYYPPNPPSKRQKLDNIEPKVENQEEEGPRSPTLEEMKADFHCTEIPEFEDVKS